MSFMIDERYFQIELIRESISDDKINTSSLFLAERSLFGTKGGNTIGNRKDATHILVYLDNQGVKFLTDYQTKEVINSTLFCNNCIGFQST